MPRLLTTALLLATSALGLAQVRTVPGQRLASPPVIDGTVDAQEWAGAAKLTDFQEEEDPRPAQFPVVGYLAYDAEAIYVAVQVTTPTVRVEQFRKNSSLSGDDRATFQIDALGVGTSMDRYVFNLLGGTSVNRAGGQAAKIEWVGEIEAKGRRTPTGWEGEVRIPWRAVSNVKPGKRDLRFQLDVDVMNVQREMVFQYETSGFDRPIWKDVELPSVPREKRYDLLAYVSGIAGPGREPLKNSGFDLRTQLTPSLTFLGTVNPDFRNIERQVLSNDYSYTERLAGEARPFFAEGSGFFGSRDIFASQRIRRLDYGFKTYGRINPRLSLGVMQVVESGELGATVVQANGSTPSQFSYGFSHVRRDVPGELSTANRLNISQRLGKLFATLNRFESHNPGEPVGFSHESYIEYGDERDQIGISLDEVSPDFAPSLGFRPTRDFRGYWMNASSNRNYLTGPLRGFGVSLGQGRSDRWSMPGRFQGGHEVALNATTRNDIALGWRISDSFFEEFDDHSQGAWFSFPTSDNFRQVGLDYSWGKIAGVPFRSFGGGWSFRPTSRITGSISGSIYDRGGVSEQYFANLSYDLNQYETVAVRAVKDGGEWNAFATYRIAGRKGSEWFVIYGDPAAEKFQNRLGLKAVFPFSF